MSKGSGANHFNMGIQLARLGRWEEAAAAYRTALQEDPENADALMNLGFVYYEMGLDQQAQDAFSAAERLRESLRTPTEKCDSNEL